MTAMRVTRLWCDQHGCRIEFEAAPELGFPPMSVMRKEAAKAGWTHVRHPIARSLDRDYCPDHKPEDTP